MNSRFPTLQYQADLLIVQLLFFLSASHSREAIKSDGVTTADHVLYEIHPDPQLCVLLPVGRGLLVARLTIRRGPGHRDSRLGRAPLARTQHGNRADPRGSRLTLNGN